MATKNDNRRWSLGVGGADEPDLLLIVDHETGVISARTTRLAEQFARELVEAANKGYSTVTIVVICDLRVAPKEASVSVVSAFVDGAEAMAEATKLAHNNVMPNRVFTVHTVELKGKPE